MRVLGNIALFLAAVAVVVLIVGFWSMSFGGGAIATGAIIGGVATASAGIFFGLGKYFRHEEGRPVFGEYEVDKIEEGTRRVKSMEASLKDTKRAFQDVSDRVYKQFRDTKTKPEDLPTERQIVSMEQADSQKLKGKLARTGRKNREPEIMREAEGNKFKVLRPSVGPSVDGREKSTQKEAIAQKLICVETIPEARIAKLKEAIAESKIECKVKEQDGHVVLSGHQALEGAKLLSELSKHKKVASSLSFDFVVRKTMLGASTPIQLLHNALEQKINVRSFSHPDVDASGNSILVKMPKQTLEDIRRSSKLEGDKLSPTKRPPRLNL